ncbi:methyltransferase [Litoribacter alkaliphilus]|uniref:tRNA1(Val) (adenine(37)-N6)-methyltransferase n=1 Tax=Litoribacter ruber TaxID=702568 RepID=A0AAP2G5Z7_9BACT|nr:methyltransferase [Litoribacter alkaliphilus]MBS9525561.1 methyltransferase [Litoribacter alkaliphilus]
MKVARPFRFKQFTVEQDRCALKVNTDAVLLGALASFDQPERTLEVGTGSGVISLMLAQRYPSTLITGVEIEDGAFEQSRGNFQNCPWSDRLQVFHQPFQSFRPKEKFDLIVSNPPYFENHLQSSKKNRNLALHTNSLSFGELLDGVKAHLSQQGRFFLILPERQMEELNSLAVQLGFSPVSSTWVYDKPGSQALRVIRSFGLGEIGKINEGTLTIKNADNEYSQEYASLLKDFLLIF